MMRPSTPLETLAMRLAMQGHPTVYIHEADPVAPTRWAFFWGALVGAASVALAFLAVLVWPVTP